MRDLKQKRIDDAAKFAAAAASIVFGRGKALSFYPSRFFPVEASQYRDASKPGDGSVR